MARTAPTSPAPPTRPTRSAPPTSARPCASSSPATTASRPRSLAHRRPGRLAPPAHTARRPISGTVGAGHTVTAGDGTWAGSAPITFTYQWQRCDAARRRLRGHRGRDRLDLRPRRTPTSATPSASRSPPPTTPATRPRRLRADAATLPAPPVNTTQPPAPTGTVVDGGTLTAQAGAWTGDGRSATTTSGSAARPTARPASTSPAPPPDLLAERRRRRPRDRRRGHRDELRRVEHRGLRPTTPPSPAPPVNTAPPSVTGSPADGGTLTADPGTWTGTTPIDLRLPVAALRGSTAAAASTSRAPPTTPTPGRRRHRPHDHRRRDRRQRRRHGHRGRRRERRGRPVAAGQHARARHHAAPSTSAGR